MFDNPNKRFSDDILYTEHDSHVKISIKSNQGESRHKVPATETQRDPDQLGNMISNQPYKNNESTDKDELSDDSVDKESVEIPHNNLNGDQYKTMTPTENMPGLRYSKNISKTKPEFLKFEID